MAHCSPGSGTTRRNSRSSTSSSEVTGAKLERGGCRHQPTLSSVPNIEVGIVARRIESQEVKQRSGLQFVAGIYV